MMNDVLSLKTEELVDEECEAHEARETRAEDETDASESKEIPIAGHLSMDQVNSLK